MAWRYHCGNCEETGAWSSRGDAEATRALHRRIAHHGLAPNHDEVQSNAERVNPMIWMYFLGGCIGLWIADKTGLLGAFLSLIPEGTPQK